MHIPTGVVKQAEIADLIAAVEAELAPDVVRIRYSIDTDWSGDWSIFVRVLLSDQASAEDKLATVTERVRARLSDVLEGAQLGLLQYFRFRSQSEQAVLNEQEWS